MRIKSKKPLYKIEVMKLLLKYSFSRIKNTIKAFLPKNLYKEHSFYFKINYFLLKGNNISKHNYIIRQKRMTRVCFLIER